jgi:hypothetical protein
MMTSTSFSYPIIGAPIFQAISRQTSERRVWVCDTTDQETFQTILHTLLPLVITLYSDKLHGYGASRTTSRIAHEPHMSEERRTYCS